MTRFVSIVSLVAVGSAALAQDLPAVLELAIRNTPNLRYSGERVIEFRKGADRTRHVEYILRDGPRTRIQFPDDSPLRGQIIVENGRERLHFFPDKNEIRVFPPRGEEALRRLKRLLDDKEGGRFNFRVEKSGEVAGLAAQAVVMTDASGNTVQRLWIEPRVGLILKREMYDKVGGIAGTFEFRRVNFNPRISRRDFVIDRRGARVVTAYDQTKDLAAKLGLTYTVLPSSSGFRLEGVRLIKPEGRDVLAHAYVGPQGRVGLFHLKGSVDEDKLRHFARGGVSTYSWSRGSESFVLIGELSRGRLRELARLLGDS